MSLSRTQIPPWRSYSPAQLQSLIAKLSPSEKLTAIACLQQIKNNEAWGLCSQRVASWDAGPLFWLTQYTKTEDSHALSKGTEFLSPFPRLEYIKILIDYMLWEQCKDPLASSSLFVLKTREMMFSWTACGFIASQCMFHNAFWMAQSAKESKGSELVNYARILYRNQPQWMKDRNPLIVDNYLELQWKAGGRFLSVPSGEDQARMFHPHGYFQDESAFLPEAEQAFNAVRPVVKQAICGSTDAIGWFHEMCKGAI
jgi:hypothetical protein